MVFKGSWSAPPPNFVEDLDGRTTTTISSKCDGRTDRHTDKTLYLNLYDKNQQEKICENIYHICNSRCNDGIDHFGVYSSIFVNCQKYIINLEYKFI